jgi:AraC-like DNA-binding protein
MNAHSAYSELRFSTDDVPASERLPFLREVVGRSIARVEYTPVEGRPLKWAVRIHALDGLVAVSAETNGLRSHRSPSLLSDGNDDVLFTINRLGFSLVSQVGRECRVDAGSAAVLTNAEPGTNDFPGPTHSLILRIPRRELVRLVGTPEDALARTIPAASAPLRLLVDYVEMALRRHELQSPRLRHLFTTHVHDLVAMAIGATHDAAEAARSRGLRAARLSSAKGEIMRRLQDEALGVTEIARHLGITPRYVQRLFESEGTTFSEFIIQQRLARAYRMLADPRFLDHTVTAIAFEVGFGNLSYFNRLFRRHYGATPSDVRATARRHAQ